MEFSESRRIVFNRIQELDPENYTKIVGYLLVLDPGEQKMLPLAMGPDEKILQLICKAKSEIRKLAHNSSFRISPSMNPTPLSPCLPIHSCPSLSPASFGVPSNYLDARLAKLHNSEFAPPTGYLDRIFELQNQTQLLSLNDQIQPANNNVRTAPGFFNLPDLPIKSCYYFNKGYCKHGDSCRFSHGKLAPDSFFQMFSTNSNDKFIEDQILRPGSLEQLEDEIVEILRSRRPNPVSIASLPAIYEERYGKVLQADGYLTESQRHGKAGFSLTKLLAQLKSSIRLIESYRPHGQHIVVLAEDAPKYMNYWNERGDPGPIVTGSRQIYMTFPAESKFTEEDISNYFNTFGPVEDVRIPCQHERMFGFVTFVRADTVQMILARGNPHFVCGAQVLAKPYREKPNHVNRKYSLRIEHPEHYSPHYVDANYDLHSMPRRCSASHLLRNQLMMEEEQALELERRRLAQFQLAQKPLTSQPYFNHSLDEMLVQEDHISYLLEVLDSDSTTEDKTGHEDTTNTDI